MPTGSRRSSFWLKAGEQAHFAISIPVLRRCSLVLVLERLSPAGEPLLLLRHEAAPRIEAWERRRASVLKVEADAWDHEGFHGGAPQARLTPPSRLTPHASRLTPHASRLAPRRPAGVPAVRGPGGRPLGRRRVQLLRGAADAHRCSLTRTPTLSIIPDPGPKLARTPTLLLALAPNQAEPVLVSLRVSLDGMAGAQRWLGAAAERALFAGDVLAQVRPLGYTVRCTV
jgi:hypothetical protein